MPDELTLDITKFASRWKNLFPIKSAENNINSTDENGQTALHRACYAGDLRKVKELLEAGADKDIRNKYHWTALIYAIEYGRTDIIPLLQ